MDPLSITSSIIAMIQISDRIVSACKHYITTAKDAPRDLRTIVIEVGSVKSVLEVLESLTQGHGDASLILDSLKEPIQHCKESLAALDSLFPAAQRELANAKRMTTLSSLATLAWPLKEGKARKALQDIGRHKITMSLALTTETLCDIKSIKADIKRLDDELIEGRHEIILKSLVVTDPSSNHNDAWILREPHTGRWLVRSPHYRDWMSGSTNFLWLHGIPGCGKTMLASFVVEEVKTFCESTALNGIGWAYYYFYFRREKDEALHFLRWVINQLCRQSRRIPVEVCKLHSDGVEPSIASLLIALSAVLRNFERVYLVLDALDESTKRQNLLNILVKILSDPDFAKLQVFATSRKELDIERALKEISTVISLNENQWVDEDIRLYIQNHLRNDLKLSRWPEPLRVEIEAALAKGAKGMFRWAFCQLDILGRLESASEIRKALGELPESLDETYELILNRIHVKNRIYAHRALQLLAFDFDVKTLGELAEAVVVNIEQVRFDPNDRLLNPEGILEICTCLITFQENSDPQVRLAHYSVKEYLVSGRMKATFFKTSEVAAAVLANKIFITYMLNLDYKLLPMIEEYKACDSDTCECCSCGGDFDAKLCTHKHAVDRANKAFPLIRAAYWRWNRRHEMIDKSQEYTSIADLTFKLLNPHRPHFGTWLKQWGHFLEAEGKYHLGPPIWTFLPGAECTVTLAYLCFFGLSKAAEIFYEKNLDSAILENQLELLNTDFSHETLTVVVCGTPLHIAASLSNVDAAKFLIAKGANTNAFSNSGWTVLNSACLGPGGPPSSILNLLLAANANPNPLDTALTPLQSAVLQPWCDPENVETLLRCGADVNAVGFDRAVVKMILYYSRNEREEDISKRILGRGKKFYYDTPLRIVESRLNLLLKGQGFTVFDDEEEDRLNKIRDVLINYGAESFRLPPIDTDSYIKDILKASKVNLKLTLGNETWRRNSSELTNIEGEVASRTVRPSDTFEADMRDIFSLRAIPKGQQSEWSGESESRGESESNGESEWSGESERSGEV